MQNIIETVLANQGRVFARINVKELERYDFLQKNLHTRDVQLDREYQRTFNRFYRVQRRTPEWYAFFYHLLEREKTNPEVSFGEVLSGLHTALGRVEASFASKLVATIRPTAPVYDAFVRQNLQLVAPTHKNPAARIDGFISLYSEMERRYEAILTHKEYSSLEKAFDLHFPQFVYFTKLKKLDLMLWQMR